jgi:hypothetical protein
MRRVLFAVLVAAMLAACGGAVPTPSASPAATLALAPTESPTASPSPSPSPSPSAPATAPSGAGAFVVAGVTATFDSSAAAPDPSAFGTSFPSDTAAIYVPYQLAPGLSGTVTSTWKASGASDVVASFDYPAAAPWAYFRLTHPGGFVPGANQEILAFGPTGESVTLDFTITGTAATPSAAPSGSAAFTLLRMATSVDRSKDVPDPSTYTDTFSTSASTVYVVFELRSGLAGKVTLTMTRGGSAVIKPVSLDITTVNGWNDFHIDSASGFPVGDYAATVTYEPTGEAQTVAFTVK